jgi:hypothetical protein
MRTTFIVVGILLFTVGCGDGPGGTGGGSGTGGTGSSAGGGSGGGSSASTGGGSASPGGGSGSTGGGSASTGGGSGSTGGSSGAPDLSCVGAALPTTAPQVITLKGTTVARALGTSPLGGVALEVLSRTGTMLASGMSDSSGNFSITMSTGGVPVDAFIKATFTGYLETDYYPRVPYSADTTSEIDLVTKSTVALLTLEAQVIANSNDSQIFASTFDCQGARLAGATLSASPAAGSTVYVSGSSPDPMATQTDSGGAVVLVNVPAGTVTLSGQMGSTELRSHTVTSAAGILIETSLRP